MISTYLQEGILLDDRLNPQSIRCWQMLFNRARFTEDLSVTMSYSDMALMLNCSVRTCIRYVNRLKANGYLEVISNREGDIHFSNTYLVRVPRWLIDEIEDQKDRGVSVWPSDRGVSTHSDRAAMEDINNNINNNNNWESGELEDEVEDSITPEAVVVDFKSDEDGDCDGVSSIDDQVLKLEEELDAQNRKLTELLTERGRIAGNDSMNAAFSDISAAISSKSALISMMERDLMLLKSSREKLIKAQNLPSQNSPDTNQRILSKTQRGRLERCLASIGIKNPAQIASEIDFEVRFGSLRFYLDSKTEMSLDRSINIALMLVRTGRWQTPFGFEKRTLN